MSAEIYSIPTNKLHPFEGHPYKVLDDEDMEALTESIRTVGIMSPLLVRPLKGVPEEYEVISGHRRLHAAIKAGDTLDQHTAKSLVDKCFALDRMVCPHGREFTFSISKDELYKKVGRII